MRVLVFLVAIVFSSSAYAKTIEFPSRDGLQITADYQKSSSSTVILLFHQAGSSRGEYKNIAPRLNKLGFSTLALDQRSGGSFDGVSNQTAKRGAQLGKGSSFLDARPDLEAAIDYARNKLSAEKVIVWGSSYSAALVLVIAGNKSPKVDGVLSFSPGEYLGGVSVEKAARSISLPTFISSAQSEAVQWQAIFNAIPEKAKPIGFVPQASGRHGSSSLNPVRNKNAEEYWEAVTEFLSKNF